MQVSVLEGALDCWVFLSCLEVLHRIEGCCDAAQLAANCSHTVGLWAYATDKVTDRSDDVALALIPDVTSTMCHDTFVHFYHLSSVFNVLFTAVLLN